MRDHAATEAMLRASGIAWTALRNGFYASAVSWLTRDAASTGLIEAPADGKVSWTTHADLAAAAAQVLVKEGRFDGPTPPLTANVAHDLADIAQVLTDLHSRPIARRVITDDEQKARLTNAGLPPTAIAVSLGLFRAARAGEFAATSSALETLIGRPPISLREHLAG